MANAVVGGGVAVLLFSSQIASGVFAGPSESGISLTCNGCHGWNGVSQGVSIPSIAGLNADYMTKAMEQFKTGKRSATIMDRIAKGYKDYELRKVARYFSRQPWVRVDTALEPSLIARGQELHERHCSECHEDSGRYQDQDVPRLAGQRPNYLLIQLEQYVDKQPKMPQPSDMAEKLAEIDRSDLPALSAFYSSVD
jgi:sulfide dehydrogenase cytochrome subunit